MGACQIIHTCFQVFIGFFSPFKGRVWCRARAVSSSTADDKAARVKATFTSLALFKMSSWSKNADMWRFVHFQRSVDTNPTQDQFRKYHHDLTEFQRFLPVTQNNLKCWNLGHTQERDSAVASTVLSVSHLVQQRCFYRTFCTLALIWKKKKNNPFKQRQTLYCKLDEFASNYAISNNFVNATFSLMCIKRLCGNALIVKHPHEKCTHSVKYS